MPPVSLSSRTILTRIVLFGMMLTCHALPAPADEVLSVERMMRLSGVAAQLETLSKELQPAVSLAIERCNENTKTALPADLPERYSHEKLISRAIKYLEDNLDEETKLNASAWFMSNAGQAITSAELNAAKWRPEKFDTQIESLRISEAWNQDRRQLVARVISQTGAHYYVASLSASVNELQQLLTLCSDGITTENYSNAINRIDNERALLAMFVRMELLLPTGAVFDSIPDETLKALVQFSASPAGKQFHHGLIRIFEQVLLTQ